MTDSRKIEKIVAEYGEDLMGFAVDGEEMYPME
jgi:hypothetical protein